MSAAIPAKSDRLFHRADPTAWPAKIYPISMDELDGLGIDEQLQLYWHGNAIEIRKRISWRWWEITLATLVVISAFGSFVIEIGWAFGWWEHFAV